jgi:hypothetical protein
MNFFLFHSWGSWSEKDKGDRVRDGKFIGVRILMERRCQRCGIIRLTKIKDD